MIILITGANGFLGSHLVEYGLKQGDQVFAFVRRASSLSTLKDKNLHVVEADYSSQEALHSQFLHLKDKFGPFDLVIHNAGLTDSYKESVYRKVNVELTEWLTSACKSADLLRPQGKLIYVSSMAALGPVGAGGPVSKYGRSKLEAENVIKKSGLPYVIFRPTGLYGPRDKQFLALFKWVKYGWYPLIVPKQKMTLIHAADVAQNIFLIGNTAENATFHLDDGNVYSHRQFMDASALFFKNKPHFLRLPRSLAAGLLSISDFFCQLTGSTASVSKEKFNEISSDWDHDFSEERKSQPLHIRFNLETGIMDTLKYYRLNNLI